MDLGAKPRSDRSQASNSLQDPFVRVRGGSTNGAIEPSSAQHQKPSLERSSFTGLDRLPPASMSDPTRHSSAGGINL